MLVPWKKSYDKPRQHIKEQRHHFASKSPYRQSHGFSSSCVWMWELNLKEGWALHQRIDAFKLWCWRRLLESSLYSKETKAVNPKENHPWIFIGRTDGKLEAPKLWPPDAKNWLIGKDLDAGKDWRQEEKRATEDEIIAWHHQLNRHESEQTLGNAEGQGDLACCSPLGSQNQTRLRDWTKWGNYKWLITLKYMLGLTNSQENAN